MRGDARGEEGPQVVLFREAEMSLHDPRGPEHEAELAAAESIREDWLHGLVIPAKLCLEEARRGLFCHVGRRHPVSHPSLSLKGSRQVGDAGHRELVSSPNPKYENARARTDGPSDRGLGGDLDRVSRALPRRASRGSDDRPRTRPPNISGCPAFCGLCVSPRWIRWPRLVLLALRASPRHPEPETAAEPTRHRGALRVDPKPDRGGSLPRGAGSRLGRRLARRGLDRVPPRDSREPPYTIRRTLPREAVRGGVPGLPRIRPSVDPAAAAASEVNGHVHARVRSHWRRPKLLQVDDLEGHAGQVTQQPFDVAFPDDRDDIAARLRDLAQRPGHRRVPLLDQDALCGRELRRKLA